MTDASVSEVYARAGIGSPIRRGQRPGILVVDLQIGFTRPEHPPGSDLSDEVAAAARVLDAARAQRLPIIFTTIAYQPSLQDGGVWLQKMPGLGCLIEGTPLVEVDPRLGRRSQEPVIVKRGASSFFGTNVASLFTAHGVDTVIVCGATTSGCVRASVVDAVQNGFPTIVVREAVGDRARPPHDSSLFDMQAKYADVIGLEEAVAYICSSPSTVSGRSSQTEKLWQEQPAG